MNAEVDIPKITPTAPLHAGKRDSNYYFLTNFRTPFKPTLVRETVSPQSSNSYQTLTKVPLPINQQVRGPDLVPFERSDLRSEIKNLIIPESTYLQFSIFFFVLFLIFLILFLLEIHPEIFLLLSILFFSLGFYPVAKYIKKRQNKNKLKTDDKTPAKLIQRQVPKKIKMKPSEKIAKYESTKQNRISSHNTEMSGDLYPPFNNSDRHSAIIGEANTIVQSTEDQIDSLASRTLNDLNLKLSDFQQYYQNLKNFIQKNIISKIVLTSDKPYVNMMLTMGGFNRDFIKKRIRELAASPFLAGHIGDEGDNQIVLHILSVWLSYLMTGDSDDKSPKNVFSEKYLITDGKEPKLDSNGNIYFIANKECNSFYVIYRPLKTNNQSNETASVERYYTYPNKDSMYSGLTLFFYIIKTKFNFLLDGADLNESPFYMSRVFESTPSHVYEKRK